MSPDKAPQHLVFISHSGTDTWIAKQIARAVAECGASHFLDVSAVEIGDDFEEKILEALNQAEEFLVLLTPWATGRKYIWAESGAAWIRKIPIVTILYRITKEELQADPDIPIFIKKRDLIDINELDNYFQQLKIKMQGG